MRKSIIIPVVCALALCLASCKHHTIYSASHVFSSESWNADSIALFEFNISDTTTADMLLFLRHTERYAYQNIWLELAMSHSDTLGVDTLGLDTLGLDTLGVYTFALDTLGFSLADQRGRWLGKSSGRQTEIAVPYKTNYHFAQSGSCKITVRQLMREDNLYGISCVGVTISAHQ